MITNMIYQQTALLYKRVFYLDQYSPTLESGVGSTKILNTKNFMATNTAMYRRSIFLRQQYPEPMPSKIGKEDLPGGFKHEAVISGQSAPLYDLSRGIVQVDNVKVLFKATA